MLIRFVELCRCRAWVKRAFSYSRYWALVENGIYYLNTRTADRQTVEFFSFSTRKIRRLFDLPESAGPDWSPSFGLAGSAHPPHGLCQAIRERQHAGGRFPIVADV